jgi:hypothetical protein
MPSDALRGWVEWRAAALDEIEGAHRAVGGTGPGRRTATQQINQAYAVLLSSQFQAFCRDLHTDCAAGLVATVADPNLRIALRSSLILNRKLDRGNPNAGNVGADFGRFGLPFWALVDAHRVQNPARKMLLDELIAWRNAIAHQDFAAGMLKGGRPALQLAQVQAWRKACNALAHSFESVMFGHIQAVTGIAPW